MDALNLFYQEPDGDRWVPGDRFPRRLVRRLWRGPSRPGGQMRVFLNLCAGLDRAGISYRANDYRHARAHPNELCCILGKRHVLDAQAWPNPLMLGPCLHDHPVSDPELFARRRVRRILVPGEWMRRMCAPAWGERVFAWPVGIDTEFWQPDAKVGHDIDVLVYEKFLWDRANRERDFLAPIMTELKRRSWRVASIRYGSYRVDDYRAQLRRSRALLFLCEHETQGMAYQEALATGVPVLAWDAGGAWRDPSYFPDRVNFSPVSSVPYWDERCGVRFRDVAEFPSALDEFSTRLASGAFQPRGYVLDHLTLEHCAREFSRHAAAAARAEDAPGA